MSQITESKTNIWKEFAAKTNGAFKEGHSWYSDSVEINFGQENIVPNDPNYCSYFCKR